MKSIGGPSRERSRRESGDESRVGSRFRSEQPRSKRRSRGFIPPRPSGLIGTSGRDFSPRHRFTLAQYLRLNFDKVRKRLRDSVGFTPSHTSALRRCRKEASPKSPAEMWRERPKPTEDSPAWHYRTGERRLHPAILVAAGLFDAVRESLKGSACFAHHNHEGRLTWIRPGRVENPQVRSW